VIRLSSSHTVAVLL